MFRNKSCRLTGDDRLAQGAANFAALDVEQVLGDAAEFEVAVRVAAGKPRQDNATLGTGYDVVEAAIAGRHEEIPYPASLRQAELARDVEIHEEAFEAAVLDDVDIGGRDVEPVEIRVFGQVRRQRPVQQAEQRAGDRLALLVPGWRGAGEQLVTSKRTPSDQRDLRLPAAISDAEPIVRIHSPPAESQTKSADALALDRCSSPVWRLGSCCLRGIAQPRRVVFRGGDDPPLVRTERGAPDHAPISF